VEGWNETVYGTEYGMKMCDQADVMNALLLDPTAVPAWSAWLYNDVLYAANNWYVLFLEGSSTAPSFVQPLFFRQVTPSRKPKVTVSLSVIRPTDRPPTYQLQVKVKLTMRFS